MTEKLNEELDTFLTKLKSSQEPLEPNIEKILRDNLWDLYVTDSLPEGEGR